AGRVGRGGWGGPTAALYSGPGRGSGGGAARSRSQRSHSRGRRRGRGERAPGGPGPAPASVPEEPGEASIELLRPFGLGRVAGAFDDRQAGAGKLAVGAGRVLERKERVRRSPDQ